MGGSKKCKAFYLSLDLFILLCMCVVFLHVYLCTTHETGVTDGGEPPCEFQESNQCPLEDWLRVVPLTSEPSL